MKKPYLDEWQRRMIIENYGFSGPMFNLNLQLNKFLKQIINQKNIAKMFFICCLLTLLFFGLMSFLYPNIFFKR